MSNRRKSKEESKIRVLAIAKMLNEGRLLRMADILRRLDLEYDIQVERKTVYKDIYAIDRIMPIYSTPGRYGGYQKYDVMEGL